MALLILFNTLTADALRKSQPPYSAGKICRWDPDGYPHCSPDMNMRSSTISLAFSVAFYQRWARSIIFARCGSMAVENICAPGRF